MAEQNQIVRWVKGKEIRITVMVEAPEGIFPTVSHNLRKLMELIAPDGLALFKEDTRLNLPGPAGRRSSRAWEWKTPLLDFEKVGMTQQPQETVEQS